jgi:hypothetical protein
MSYLRYLCLFTHSCVQHILCCVFVLFFLPICVPYVAKFDLSLYFTFQIIHRKKDILVDSTFSQEHRYVSRHF